MATEPGNAKGAAGMRPKRILVTTDFSTESRKAFPYATQLAGESGGEIDLVAVVEPPSFMSGMEAVPVVLDSGQTRAAAAEHLARWADIEFPTNLKVNPIVREGKPYAEIVAAAKELGSDMIVISTHGYSGLKHAFMGSTAERVVRHAPCPVLVVRETER